jgi:hypothetical protein
VKSNCRLKFVRNNLLVDNSILFTRFKPKCKSKDFSSPFVSQPSTSTVLQLATSCSLNQPLHNSCSSQINLLGSERSIATASMQFDTILKGVALLAASSVVSHFLLNSKTSTNWPFPQVISAALQVRDDSISLPVVCNIDSPEVNSRADVSSSLPFDSPRKFLPNSN